MISRREFLGSSLGAGASLVFAPELVRAFQQSGGKLIQRAIPSSGEMVPVISFSPRQEADHAAMKDILKTFTGNGGRVIDVLHGGPLGEQAAREAASELGIQNSFFWTTPLSVSIPILPGASQPKADPAAVRATLEAKLATFQAPKIDLVMTGMGGDLPTVLAVLREMKKEGRVRYIGVHALAPPANVKAGPPVFANFESIIRNESVDFIGTDYHAGDRRLEEKILPLAQERKVGVLAYFSFDRGRLFRRASATPLPEWAAEFDAKTWAQFFLKYVISHPAVVMARTGTTSAAHMLDNIGGGTGRLPDEAARRRMAELVDSLPPTPVAAVTDPKLKELFEANKAPGIVLAAGVLDRYVGEYTHTAAGTTMTIRREGDTLLVKVQGSAPEGALIARSETRFSTPWPGATLEFQLDGQGRVSGAIVRMGVDGGITIPLVRK
jgi:aryl-alcohol dehydrogenase-like predicted oxidoreductase